MIDVELYGGRRGYLAHVKERAKLLLGAYSRAAQVDWPAVRRLVFVCKGNICRSPYAEVKARALGLDAVSFGFEAEDGTTANADALRIAAGRGVPLQAHRSALLRAGQLRAGDFVLLFEPEHLLRYAGGGHAARASLLGLWASPRRPLVWDPYGKSDRYFESCFDVIDSGVSTLAQRLRHARS